MIQKYAPWLILLLVIALPMRIMAAPYLQGSCAMWSVADLMVTSEKSVHHGCCEDTSSAPQADCDQCLIACVVAGAAMLHCPQILTNMVFAQASVFVAPLSKRLRFSDTPFKPPRYS